MNKKQNLSYITFNDLYSGIYISQVLEVLKLYEKNNIDIRLISFVSIRFYFPEKRKIKKQYNRSVIIPIIFGLKFWSIYRFILFFLIYNNEIVLCRGIFSANLALISRRKKCKIIYDGRGAISSENNEYGVYKDTGTESDIFWMEKDAVLKSDYRIAVSKKLVEYWNYNFNYSKNNHVIIPSCTSFFSKIKNYNNGFNNSDDVTIVFSGSLSEWHSFEIMIKKFEDFLLFNENIKILILSKKISMFTKLSEKYPSRINVLWVEPSQVIFLLLLADYGYIYRNQSETNKVASPVKIAEYLSCGLKLLISDKLGDYSQLVRLHNLGFNLDSDDFDIENIKKINNLEKERLSRFALENLSLDSEKIRNKYLGIINEINSKK